MTLSLDLAVIEKLLPERSREVTRLGKLFGKKALPVVAVIGKYNHGKSRLLNELIGSDVFKVADIRQTVALKRHKHKGVYWLDSPGLDADTSGHDDALANQGAWLEADIRLFVHSAKEGELDLSEVRVLGNLRGDSRKTGRLTLVVLTQIDSIPSKDDLAKVHDRIKEQAGSAQIFEVSSTRFRKGMGEGKNLLVEESGIPELKDRLRRACLKVNSDRSREVAMLLKVLLKDIEELEVRQKELLDGLKKERASMVSDFTRKLEGVISMSQEKLGVGKLGGALSSLPRIPIDDI